MSHPFTAAEIFQAKACGCDLDQILPQGKTCRDCRHVRLCVLQADPPTEEGNRHCLFSPSRFDDHWRIRIDKIDEEQEEEG
jgi:hypothetical protein